jgi:subtilisin family serine protease
MKKIFIPLFTLLTFIIGCNRGSDLVLESTILEEANSQSINEVSENEYIVKRKGIEYLEGDSAFAEKYELEIVKKIPGLMVDVVKASKSSYEKLKNSPSIEYVEPNYVRKMNFQTSQENYSYSSSLKQTGIIKANSIFKGRAFTTVAIISTGIDMKHPDLQGKIVNGFSTFSKNDTPQDINGVGTYQAGLIVASNPEQGVIGIAPNCKVMPIKAISENGIVKDSDLIHGIALAVDYGANVITFTAEGKNPSRALEDAVKYAFNKKVPVVVGAGDSSSSEITYPAATQGVISVSALSNNMSKLSTSNFGEWISLSAPGESVKSTSLTTSKSKISPNYAFLSGTLVSSSYVAGTIALLKSQYPQIDMISLRKHLELTTDDIGIKGPDNEFGFGSLNVVKALSIKPLITIQNKN